MSDPPQFDAEALAAGAVAKDGRTAVIEFVAGDERLWVTLPIGALSSLAQVCAELEALGADARERRRPSLACDGAA